jgi:hypothetical protein
LLAVKRINDYGEEHPWRFAAVGFLTLVLFSALGLAIFHRNWFTGLFAAYGVSIGWAMRSSARRRGRSIPFWRKVSLPHSSSVASCS